MIYTIKKTSVNLFQLPKRYERRMYVFLTIERVWKDFVWYVLSIEQRNLRNAPEYPPINCLNCNVFIQFCAIKEV
jgi:hypothetical protein